MGKIVTFGEIMLRLAPNGYYRFVQAQELGLSLIHIYKIPAGCF